MWATTGSIWLKCIKLGIKILSYFVIFLGQGAFQNNLLNSSSTTLWFQHKMFRQLQGQKEINNDNITSHSTFWIESPTLRIVTHSPHRKAPPANSTCKQRISCSNSSSSPFSNYIGRKMRKPKQVMIPSN